MIAGIEHNMIEILREEWPEVKAMKEGKIPTNDLFLVKRMGEFHAGVIALDHLRIRRYIEEHEGKQNG